MEPMKHQYDFDTATVIGFLREYDLLDDFKLILKLIMRPWQAILSNMNYR